RASERAIAATDLPPRAHAQALILAIGQELARGSNYFGIQEGAERIVRQIDVLPDSLADLKLAAHQQMLGRYEYLDVDDGLRDHAKAVLAIARKFGKPEPMASAYLSLARSAADYLHPDSALAILDRAEKELGSTPAVQRTFQDFRHRYALIGTPAAAVTGEWSLNFAEAPKVVQPGNGKVTLVEFTAHWCMPCKNSYPGIRSLADRFRGKPFEGVLVTSLYGFLGDQKNLKPDEEVAADEIYLA